MNTIKKIFFWLSVIVLSFINPLIGFGLIVLYYLPGIIQNLCQTCNEEQKYSEIKSYSEDILRDMK